MTRQYDHYNASLFILKQGSPENAEFLEGVEFYCSEQGAGKLNSTNALDFWSLENGDTVALTYEDFGPRNVYRESELIVRIDNIDISYKALYKRETGFEVSVSFVGDFTWALGVDRQIEPKILGIMGGLTCPNCKQIFSIEVRKQDD